MQPGHADTLQNWVLHKRSSNKSICPSVWQSVEITRFLFLQTVSEGSVDIQFCVCISAPSSDASWQCMQNNVYIVCECG